MRATQCSSQQPFAAAACHAAALSKMQFRAAGFFTAAVFTLAVNVPPSRTYPESSDEQEWQCFTSRFLYTFDT